MNCCFMVASISFTHFRMRNECLRQPITLLGKSSFLPNGVEALKSSRLGFGWAWATHRKLTKFPMTFFGMTVP